MPLGAFSFASFTPSNTLFSTVFLFFVSPVNKNAEDATIAIAMIISITVSTVLPLFFFFYYHYGNNP